MTPCDQLQDWVSARLDGEIDSDTNQALEEHLVSCKHCQAMDAQYRWAKRVLSQPGSREAAPDSLRVWLKGVLKEEASAQGRRKSYAVAGLLVCIIIVLSGGWLVFRPFTADRLGAKELNVVREEVVSDHIRCMLRPGEKVDYKTADPEEARSWLQRYLDFAVKVPALNRRDFSLLGARVTYFLDRRVGGLLYKRAGTKQFASLFILNGKGLKTLFDRKLGRPYKVLVNHGYEIVAWNEGGIFYFFVSHDADFKTKLVSTRDAGME